MAISCDSQDRTISRRIRQLAYFFCAIAIRKIQIENYDQLKAWNFHLNLKYKGDGFAARFCHVRRPDPFINSRCHNFYAFMVSRARFNGRKVNVARMRGEMELGNGILMVGIFYVSLFLKN